MRNGRPDVPFCESDAVDPRPRGTRCRRCVHGGLWSYLPATFRYRGRSPARSGRVDDGVLHRSRRDAHIVVGQREWWHRTVARLTTAANRLDALPDGSPSGGPAAVSSLLGRLNDLHDDTVAGRESLTALPPNATESDLGHVMGTVWSKVASLAGDPLATGGISAPEVSAS
jgi:hypothetical protein